MELTERRIEVIAFALAIYQEAIEMADVMDDVVRETFGPDSDYEHATAEELADLRAFYLSKRNR